MTLSIISLLIAAIIGVVVWIICQQIPYVSKQPLPVLLELLAALLAYFGGFGITA